ncbi:MAG: TetR/AcrR family transcriptional regulator C-terminal ligand-binding domain-containing protein [Nocardioidaceae bacterium]
MTARSTSAAGAVEQLLARAVERREADPAKLTPRVNGVPLDLFRQELLMTLKPVPDEVIESIVDEVFVPLVRAAAWVDRDRVSVCVERTITTTARRWGAR